MDSGCKVVFDQGWSYIEDKGTEEKTSLVRKGGLYVLDSWVKAKRAARGIGRLLAGQARRSEHAETCKTHIGTNG